MLKIEYSNKFIKDYKIAIKRGCVEKDLQVVIEYLFKEVRLPYKYRNHKLNNYLGIKGVKECHINPDWLLIYQIDKEKQILKLIRNGKHSDLFK